MTFVENAMFQARYVYELGFFFSREEPRMHVHIISPEGEAKFWMEPMIALADYHGYSEKQLKTLCE